MMDRGARGGQRGGGGGGGGGFGNSGCGGFSTPIIVSGAEQGAGVGLGSAGDYEERAKPAARRPAFAASTAPPTASPNFPKFVPAPATPSPNPRGGVSTTPRPERWTQQPPAFIPPQPPPPPPTLAQTLPPNPPTPRQNQDFGPAPARFGPPAGGFQDYQPRPEPFNPPAQPLNGFARPQRATPQPPRGYDDSRYPPFHPPEQQQTPPPPPAQRMPYMEPSMGQYQQHQGPQQSRRFREDRGPAPGGQQRAPPFRNGPPAHRGGPVPGAPPPPPPYLPQDSYLNMAEERPHMQMYPQPLHQAHQYHQQPPQYHQQPQQYHQQAPQFQQQAQQYQQQPYQYHGQQQSPQQRQHPHQQHAQHQQHQQQQPAPPVQRMGADFGRLCTVRTVDWDSLALPEVRKSFYVESDKVMREWLQEHQILLHGANIPRPCFEFDEPGFPAAVQQKLAQAYDRPTLIQCISWPVVLSGQDMVAIARTGSGKTLAFLLPAIVHCLGQETGQRGSAGGPTVLVLLPTRELAQQACDVARDFCQLVGLSVTAVFGGVFRDHQQQDLRRGVDICIATPGRLLGFLHSRTVSLNACSFLVLDEADRMLEMGFEEQIRAIISQIRPDRQTVMFSATWPVEVREFAKSFQSAPVFLNVGSLELSANHNITQHIEVLEEREKPQRLEQLLEQLMEQDDHSKVMVFFDTKRRADDLERRLAHRWRVLCIHGDKLQQQRDQVMQDFKRGSGRILLATDVAARGLDVSNVEAVINYDYPMSTEQYVHRIGRTARHDKHGSAFSFFTPRNAQRAADLIKVLEEAKQQVPEQLRELAYPSRGLGGAPQSGNALGTVCLTNTIAGQAHSASKPLAGDEDAHQDGQGDVEEEQEKEQQDQGAVQEDQEDQQEDQGAVEEDQEDQQQDQEAVEEDQEEEQDDDGVLEEDQETSTDSEDQDSAQAEESVEEQDAQEVGQPVADQGEQAEVEQKKQETV